MPLATRLPSKHTFKRQKHSIRHRYQIKQIGVKHVLIFKSRYRLCVFFSETICLYEGAFAYDVTLISAWDDCSAHKFQVGLEQTDASFTLSQDSGCENRDFLRFRLRQ